MSARRGKRLHAFETAVLRTIRTRKLYAAPGPLLAAVSGGPDSMAMLSALSALRPELGFSLHCCHVIHGLHEDCDTHAEFVASACTQLGVPCDVRSVRVRERAQDDGISIEHAAREERYAALRGAAQSMASWTSSSVIATGHTATDRAETVLLNVLRGTGPKGLQGVPPRREEIVRPLIDMTRADVLGYVADNDIEFVEDPTNASLDFRRNRVRLELLPEMARVVGHAVEPALTRLADAVELEQQAVLEAENVLWNEVVLANDEDVRLDARALCAMSDGAASLVLRRAVREVAGPGSDLSMAHVREVLQLVRSHNAGGFQCGGGCEFMRDREILRVRRRDSANK